MPESRSIFGLPAKRTPLVMGILNVTPDSFSDGGRYVQVSDAVGAALRMVEDGADVVDIGGESSRPGAEDVGEAEELRRVLPVIEALRERIRVPMSIDTRRARVAHEALQAGCSIVNDISACRDPEMPGIIKERHTPVVVMHMRGEPKTMQQQPAYDDVVAEVGDFFKERIDFLKRAGIGDDRIVLDPGIGFGKRFRDNLELLRGIESLARFGCPLLVGASRKAFLGVLLDAPAENRLVGSLAVAARCHQAGVDIVRVHDVRETVQLFRVLDATEYREDYPADW